MLSFFEKHLVEKNGIYAQEINYLGYVHRTKLVSGV